MSGSVLAVGVLGATVLLAGAALPAVGAVAAQQNVQNAADAAALAAADTISGRSAGYPCDNARRAATLDGAELASCETSGPVALVSARARYLSFEVSARARAGPPGTP
ncbi:Rv3654c family TadE-like protein [Gryllotalpicola ginsengisoli]|uniref:Rv3654c family TadE-like protein n=1 Tax=Gryllotalpicola ginsengisoli TaxID=444608 RepID=UPI0003B4445C|nr:Rv3654c family TadE-like protein [Gryllotalpicola ginsengisoli]